MILKQHIVMAIAYNGARFKGWQSQKKQQVLTVQETVEAALSKIENAPIKVICAGRTDARVHAECQIIHFISENNRPSKAWVEGANCHLPHDIRIRWVHHCQDDSFHARFSAEARTYRYIIYNQAVMSAPLYGLATHCEYSLDVAAMHSAAQSLLGEHDFTSLRGVACQANNAIRVVHNVRVDRQGDLIFFDIKANAFLLHMVRNIAGMLIAIGKGKYPPAYLAEVITLKDRREADVTAPPHGLYLVAVDYAKKYKLPSTCFLPQINELQIDDFFNLT